MPNLPLGLYPKKENEFNFIYSIHNHKHKINANIITNKKQN